MNSPHAPMQPIGAFFFGFSVDTPQDVWVLFPAADCWNSLFPIIKYRSLRQVRFSGTDRKDTRVPMLTCSSLSQIAERRKGNMAEHG